MDGLCGMRNSNNVVIKKKKVVIPVPKPAGEVSTVQGIPPKHYAGYGAGYGGKSETI